MKLDDRPTLTDKPDIASTARTSASPDQYGRFLKNLLLATTSGLGLMLLLILIGIWRAGTSAFTWLDDLVGAPPAAPEVDVPTLVVTQVRGASELTTAVFSMEAVVPVEQERRVGNVPIASTRLLYIAHGQVRAGVDLQELTPDRVTVLDGNAVRIRLPAPEILDSKIDVRRSRVYTYDRGFLGLGPDVAPQLQTLAAHQTLDKIVTSACASGLLEEANNRARLAVAQLLAASGRGSVRVETTPPAPETCRA
ncbi:hypothetical protein KR51_00034010 [Rubidibacter lacunae KORDI 51-2]|uniref:DUF4230 domain-containing protein n=1 Tax=Rubidibacter lacunae KORDI 51-2 TaxID=582515 RepID=U5DHP3_9CHRO|nr:DUF4230 domain-containing protein [Rubidibacter lacunae]ERN40114.1 hypothetical protein KR51_00034010 [Rubidibacter lacunae KORDI 51-2]